MKTTLSSLKYSLSAALLIGAAANVRAAVTVGVDPSATWIGFMNVFELPSHGGAFVFNGGWGTADLNASFAGPVATLTPNTSISRDVPLTDTFWWQANGEGNKNMDANFYVQSDAIAGQTVNFTGLVLGNTLVSPYASTIFIKEFNSDFSSLVGITTTPVVPGIFNLTLATAPGHHIQYGFETIGPNARLDEVAGFGNVQVTAVPEPSTAVLLMGGVLSLAGISRRLRTHRQS